MARQEFVVTFEHPDSFEALRLLSWAISGEGLGIVQIHHADHPVELSVTLLEEKGAPNG